MATVIDKAMIADNAENVAGTCECAASRRTARLETVYRRHARYVYTLCRRLLADVSLAEATTAEVFVRFNRELGRWWNEARALARLRELAIDEALACLDLRGSKAQPITMDFNPSATPLPARVGESRSQTLDSAALDALLLQLPDKLRVTFVLRDIEGLSDQAIAAHLHVDEAEARRLVHVARLELRRLWLSP